LISPPPENRPRQRAPRFRCFRAAVFVAGCLSAGLALSASLVVLDERDYQANVAATDRFWFYKNLDGSDQDPPFGNGQYNGLEYFAGRPWQIERVVYIRNNSIQMRLKFRNTYRNAITANLHWSAVRLRVPPGFNRPTETYLHLTPPADQQLTMGAWNERQT
jgi:hypothetical protein